MYTAASEKIGEIPSVEREASRYYIHMRCSFGASSAVRVHLLFFLGQLENGGNPKDTRSKTFHIVDNRWPRVAPDKKYNA